MPAVLQLSLTAVWIVEVQARNETIVHGWVPGPHGRGTWSILWSCLATIFLCTWSALHLDVPKRHGRRYLIFRKLRWMFLAATAPEIILASTASNYIAARSLSKSLAKKFGRANWTLVHTSFAFAGGFRVLHPGENGLGSSIVEDVCLWIETTETGEPPISEQELESRAKSDWLIKLVAILQIIWFVVQTLFRAIQHYKTTALEIMTIAFVFCSLFIYAFAWNQPQNIEYPVIMKMPETAHHTAISESDQPAIDAVGFEISSSVDRVGTGQSGLFDQYLKERARNEYLVLIVFITVGCGFGALHCLAWNSPFPTSEEGLAWHVCSIATAVLPAILSTVMLAFWSRRATPPEMFLFWLLTGLYIVGRITIIVLAFMALRDLPADAFQTVDWGKYIPHFAA